MLQKLACVAVLAGGLHSVPAFAQFAPVRTDDGVTRSGAMELSHLDEASLSGKTLSLTHAAGLVDESIGLSDSERFQLRQQIREAAQEIYAAPSRKPALSQDVSAAAMR